MLKSLVRNRTEELNAQYVKSQHQNALASLCQRESGEEATRGKEVTREVPQLSISSTSIDLH